MHRIFQHRRIVGFGECDPAKAVYYPVFFHWFHQAMEAWFEAGLQIPYSRVLQRIGFPAKQTSAEFYSPCRMGEKLLIELWISKLGISSMMLQIRVKCEEDDQLRASGEVLCVCIGMKKGDFQFQKQAIPDELRERMKSFVCYEENM